MALIFPRWTNRLPAIALVVVSVVVLAVVLGVWYWFSPKFTDVGYAPKQPVLFSHKLHTGDLGMDCRYCHNTVEYAKQAAVPPTDTCMNCHKTIMADSFKLDLVRNSAESGKPIRWTRVHMLPDYTYFDHGVHLAAGVGCESCHGRVDRMKVVRQVMPLSMGWCLDCHRDPEPGLRPREEVTVMGWEDTGQKEASPRGGRKLSPPTHCSGCHR